MSAPESKPDAPSTPRVVVEVTIAAPIETVWRALRDPALLAQWFGWDYEKLAEEIEMIFLAKESVEAVPGRRLDLGTDVFELEDLGGRTRVRGIRSTPPASDTWDGVYDDIDEGWRTFVHQLAFWLELQGGVARDVSPRRTVYLAGHRASADAPSLTGAVGASGLDGLAPGAPFRLTATTGDVLAGTVRFRTEHQLGVSVDAWGPGLLVFAGRPPSNASPHGGGFALITLFGGAAADRARVAARWEAAWRVAFDRVSLQT
jgi:hypothetical protein